MFNSVLNFYSFERTDRSLNALELSVYPSPHLDIPISSNFILNATYAMYGHFTNWKQPTNQNEKLTAIALPIFFGMTTVCLSSSLKRYSIKLGMEDLALNVTYFSVYSLCVNSQGFDLKRQWYDIQLMGESFPIGVTLVAKKCARYILIGRRSPNFPPYIFLIDEIARSLITYSTVVLSEKYEIGKKEKMVRNLAIQHIVYLILTPYILKFSNTKWDLNLLKTNIEFVAHTVFLRYLIGKELL